MWKSISFVDKRHNHLKVQNFIWKTSKENIFFKSVHILHWWSSLKWTLKGPEKNSQQFSLEKMKPFFSARQQENLKWYWFSFWNLKTKYICKFFWKTLNRSFLQKIWFFYIWLFFSTNAEPIEETQGISGKRPDFHNSLHQRNNISKNFAKHKYDKFKSPVLDEVANLK